MSELGDIGVIVSPHATQQFRKRYPKLAQNDAAAVVLIYGDVMEALKDGRKSKRKPRWLSFVNRSKALGRTWFVWTIPEDRGYVVYLMKNSEIRQRKSKRTYVVKTALTPLDQQRPEAMREQAKVNQRAATSGKYAAKGRRT